MRIWMRGLVVAGFLFCLVSGRSPAKAQNTATDKTPATQAQSQKSSKQKAIGRVLDKEGKPVTGAQIFVTPLGEERPLVAAADANGSFTLELQSNHLSGDALARIAVMHPTHGLTGGLLKTGENEFRFGAMGIIGGRVLDFHDKPVEGVTVQLTSWRMNKSEFAAIYNPTFSDLIQKYTTRSDAQGHWKLDGVPQGALVVRMNDPRFVFTTQYVSEDVLLDNRKKLDFRARPGATVEGRVVDESGKPVAAVRVFAQQHDQQNLSDGYWAEAVSGADGKYLLTGLSNGRFNVMADNEKEGEIPLLAQAVSDVQARENASTAVADLTLRKPLFVTGIVTNDGKPVKGAMIGGYGPHRPQSGAAIISATTDENGRYSLAVLPGSNRIYLSGVPKGFYSSPDDGRDLDVKVNESPVLNFVVEKSLALRGVAVDENGAPVKGVNLELTARRYWYEKKAESDAQGQWEMNELQPGDARLNVSGDWEIVGSADVKIPHPQPLRVVVRRAPQQDLKARVLDTAGKPVDGATVIAQIHTSLGDYGRTRELKTQSAADGGFKLEGVRFNEAVFAVRAHKVGYVFLASSRIAEMGQRGQLRDLILAPANNRIHGRVVDGENRPVTDATVLLLDIPGEAQADSKGHFEIKNAPVGAEVLAVSEQGIAQQELGAEVEMLLKLHPPQAAPELDVESAYRVLKSLWQDSEGKEFYSRGSLAAMLQPFDVERAAELRMERQQSVLGDVMNFSLQEPELVALAARLQEIPQNSMRAYAAAFLGLRLADTKRDVTTQLLTQAAETLKKQGLAPDNGDEYSLIMSYGLAAGLAARLDDKRQANLFHEYALTLAERFYNDGPKQNNRPTLSDVKRLIMNSEAMGDATFAKQLLEEIPVGERRKALGDTLRQMTMTNLTGARELLKIFPQLPAEKNDDADVEYGRSALSIIEAATLSKSPVVMSGDEMVEIAHKISSSYHRAVALALAANQLPLEKAKPLFHEAFEVAKIANQQGRYDSAQSRVAALALQNDAELGRTLMQKLWDERQKNDKRIPAGSHVSNRELARLAFFTAPVFPAQSRLLLERAWNRSRTGDSYDLQSLVLAMCALDTSRAGQMALRLSEREQFDTRRKIAQYLLLDNKTRRAMDFSRWQASDTWIPGTASTW